VREQDAQGGVEGAREESLITCTKVVRAARGQRALRFSESKDERVEKEAMRFPGSETLKTLKHEKPRRAEEKVG